MGLKKKSDEYNFLILILKINFKNFTFGKHINNRKNISESCKPHISWLFSLRNNNSKLYWLDKGCLVDTEEGLSGDIFDITLSSYCIFSLSLSSSSSSSFEVNGTLKASGNEWEI